MIATPTRPQRHPTGYRADGLSSVAWQVTLVTILMAALSVAVVVSAAAIRFLA
jgi:hypothetical protein